MTLLGRPVESIRKALTFESIKMKILLLAAVATLLPSLTMAWVSYHQNTRAVSEKLREELRAVSSQTAREVELWLAERVYDVRVFASSYEVSENLARVLRMRRDNIGRIVAAERMGGYLEYVRQQFAAYEQLVVLDATGRVIATSGADTTQFVWDPKWMDVVKGDDAAVGEPAWSESAGSVVITVAFPVKATEDSRFIGALAATVNLEAVEEVLSRFSPGETGKINLLDRRGRLILSSQVPGQDVTHLMLYPDAAEALSGRVGEVAEYQTGEGDAVGTLRDVPRLDWRLLAEIPRAEAYAQVGQIRWYTLWMVCGLLLVVGLIAYRLALLIVRPLDRLTAGAAEVAQGDLAVDLPAVSGGGEVAYLTQVFNDMVGRLEYGQAELQKKNDELARLSITDSLTGLSNRRHLMESINLETSRSRRNQHTFAILMIDVDHFKKYNDSHGHQAGDEVLVRMAAILKGVTRDVDTVSRYGGEEFLLLLPESDQNAAVEVAERIRERLKDQTFDGESVTVSIGVAEFPIDGDGPSQVISGADSALYQAKREGRNVVVRAEPSARRRPRLRKA